MEGFNCMALQFGMKYKEHKKNKSIVNEAISSENKDKSITKLELSKIPGLGSTSIAKLAEAGITTIELLSAASEDVLKKILTPISRKQVKLFLEQNQ